MSSNVKLALVNRKHKSSCGLASNLQEATLYSIKHIITIYLGWFQGVLLALISIQKLEIQRVIRSHRIPDLLHTHNPEQDLSSTLHIYSSPNIICLVMYKGLFVYIKQLQLVSNQNVPVTIILRFPITGRYQHWCNIQWSDCGFYTE